ncbi:MAG: hypothetical protein H7Z19_10145 [Chitinophagaceae bacterium]|nr:hypothetical protein [Rubrivivax sp.]
MSEDQLEQRSVGLNGRWCRPVACARQVLDMGTPVLAANRRFHRLLVTGVPVQCPSTYAMAEATAD